jgi:hypothetical protein
MFRFAVFIARAHGRAAVTAALAPLSTSASSSPLSCSTLSSALPTANGARR